MRPSLHLARLAVPALLAAAALAQNVAATLPSIGSLTNLDRPFPGGIGRYQQWYAAQDMVAGFVGPVRLERVEFFAGSSLSANATTIDMEVSVCHGVPSGLTGLFDFNYAETPQVV